jgi:GT2 family glycosyltransferase
MEGAVGMLVAAIPSRYRREELIAEVRGLLYDEGVDKVLVYDNGYSESDAARIRTALSNPRVEVIDANGWGLHRMWNAAWEWCQDQGGEVSLAILNDDIELAMGTLSEMARRLRSRDDVGMVYPETGGRRKVEEGIDRTGGLVDTGGRSLSQRGMTGHVFMFRAEVDPIVRAVPGLDPETLSAKFDERFGWWYGDEDIVLKWALAGWKIARCVGVPSKHVKMGSQSARLRDDLTPIRKADWVLFVQLYGPSNLIPAEARIARWPDAPLE